MRAVIEARSSLHPGIAGLATANKRVPRGMAGMMRRLLPPCIMSGSLAITERGTRGYGSSPMSARCLDVTLRDPRGPLCEASRVRPSCANGSALRHEDMSIGGSHLAPTQNSGQDAKSHSANMESGETGRAQSLLEDIARKAVEMFRAS